MSSASRWLGQAGGQPGGFIAGSLCVVAAVLGLSASSPRPVSPAAPLRVCADPNNLPFSNDKREGLENQLADLVARELKTSVEYVWWAQRRGFIRNTLASGRCDIVMGVPSALSSVAATKPYYRSRYV